MEFHWLLLATIALAVVYDFFNGMNDSGNIVATMISTGAMKPRQALLLASVAEFCGPFLFGVAVAAAIGHGIVNASATQPLVVLAALVAAITWNLASLRVGIPSSSSHGLVGGLIGAAVMAEGFGAVNLNGVLLIVGAMLLSPILGFVCGYLVMRGVVRLCRNATPRVNAYFRQGQIATSIALALSHGTNDAQKTMGVITLALVADGVIPEFKVPLWVIVLSAGTIAIGMLTGGQRTIRTLGGKMYRLRPIHGFSAQLTSAAVIVSAALLGGPVSTAQVVSSSIIGVGSAERLSKVRWEVARNIMMAWVITIPMSAGVAAIVYLLLSSLARWGAF